MAGAGSTIPTGNSIGSFTPQLSLSAFIDYAYDNGNYYGFVTNNFPGRLVRLDFGNSLLNTPTATDLGNFGGVVPDYGEGIQVVKNEGNWYVMIVGDQPVGRIVNLNFGPSLSNLNPVATNWGNIGNLSYPHDLHVFKDGPNWYGFKVNALTNTVTRFSFTNSFSNTPTGVNLGNLGNLNFPTGIYAVSHNNNWHVFITSATNGGNSPSTSLSRLDFGNSLLNTPTAVNLGNLGVLRTARDLTIYQSCDEIVGYIVNYSTANDIVKLNFNNNLTATPTATSIGNIGNLNFPVCLGKIFRVNNDLYSFVTNANTNAISRLQFSGCNSSSIPSSTAVTPPAITYNAPGTYNINLTIDEGLATQQSFCRQVVVVAAPTAPTVSVTQPTCTTPTGAITVTSPLGAGLSYSINGAAYDTTRVFSNLPPGVYNVTAQSITGCISPVTSVTINAAPSLPPAPTVTVVQPTCTAPTGTITITAPLGAALTYSINGTSYDTTKVYGSLSPGTYNVTAQNGGCISSITPVTINSVPGAPSAPTVVVTQPTCAAPTGTITITAPTGAGMTYSINGTTYDTTTTFAGLAPAVYNVTAQASGCVSPVTSVTIVSAPVVPAPIVTVTQPDCTTSTGIITITSPIAPAFVYSINGTTYSTATVFTNIAPGTYNVTVKDTTNDCISAPAIETTNAAPGTPAAPTVSITQPTCTVATGTITVTSPTGAGLAYSIDGVDYSNTTGVFTTLAPGTYNVTVRNSSGCTSTATVAVINTDPSIPPTPVVTVTQPTCSAPSGTIDVTYPIAGAMTYNIDGTTYSPNNVFSGVAPGTYNVTVNNGSCTSTATVATVNAVPSLVLALSATPNPVNAGSSVNLVVTGNTAFTVTGWQPAAMFSNQTATSQTVVVSTPTTFVVSGMTADSCVDTAQVTVTVKSNDEVWVPNTFTPNSNGRNDVLYVYGNSIDRLEFTIWNQWGEKIFTTTDKTKGWDGTGKGKPQPMGVYVYVAKAVLFSGKEVMLKGAINLIR